MIKISQESERVRGRKIEIEDTNERESDGEIANGVRESESESKKEGDRASER